jgi:hypothetical protein
MPFTLKDVATQPMQFKAISAKLSADAIVDIEACWLGETWEPKGMHNVAAALHATVYANTRPVEANGVNAIPSVQKQKGTGWVIHYGEWRSARP